MLDAPSPTDDGSRSVVIENDGFENDAREPDVGESDATETDTIETDITEQRRRDPMNIVDASIGGAAAAESPAMPDEVFDPELDAVVAAAGPVTVAAADVRTGPEAGVPVDLARWAELAAASLAHLGAAGELQLSFVDVDEITELNREHMGSDAPTDVLSFPLDGVDDHPDNGDADIGNTVADEGVAASAAREVPTIQPSGWSGPPRLLGDIVVCPEVAALNAPTHAGTVDDELALLVVHGVLHVLGYDHAERAETERMRAQERDLLARYHWDGTVPAGFHHEHLDDRPSTDLTADSLAIPAEDSTADQIGGAS